MYLVIDTWVWCKAQTTECLHSMKLLIKICMDCSHKILYDYEEEILDEYKNHINEPFMKRLFWKMAFKGKFVPRPRQKICIDDFDKSDIKFLQVAKSVHSTPVVSGESDFIKLREEDINNCYLILTPQEAIAALDLVQD